MRTPASHSHHEMALSERVERPFFVGGKCGARNYGDESGGGNENGVAVQPLAAEWNHCRLSDSAF